MLASRQDAPNDDVHDAAGGLHDHRKRLVWSGGRSHCISYERRVAKSWPLQPIRGGMAAVANSLVRSG